MLADEGGEFTVPWRGTPSDEGRPRRDLAQQDARDVTLSLFFICRYLPP